MQFQGVSGATVTDSADNPLMDQLRTLKQKAIDLDRLHHDFWIANPACIDVEAFNAKAITYFLNPTHQGGFTSDGRKKSSGRDKAVYFKKHTGFGQDADSVNKVYNMLACDLANPAKSLYQVKYTDRGIRAHYLTAVKSCAPNLEEELVFIDHSWQTNYVTPNTQTKPLVLLRV